MRQSKWFTSRDPNISGIIYLTFVYLLLNRVDIQTEGEVHADS